MRLGVVVNGEEVMDDKAKHKSRTTAVAVHRPHWLLSIDGSKTIF